MKNRPSLKRESKRKKKETVEEVCSEALKVFFEREELSSTAIFGNPFHDKSQKLEKGFSSCR